MKENKYYYLGAASIIILLGLGTYSYLTYNMNKAYKTKDYRSIHDTTQIAKYVSLDARDMILKSSLEKTIEITTTTNKMNYVDPVNFSWKLYVETKVGAERMNYKSKWMEFFNIHSKKVDEQLAMADTLFEDVTSGKAKIYDELLEKSKLLEYRGQEIYEASCYSHYIIESAKKIKKYIFQYYKENNISKLNTLETQINNCLTTIDNQMVLIDTKTDMDINKYFFEQYDQVISELILHNYRLLPSSVQEGHKLYMKEINKQLYDKLSYIDSGRDKYPRAQEEKDRIKSISKIIHKK